MQTIFYVLCNVLATFTSTTQEVGATYWLHVTNKCPHTCAATIMHSRICMCCRTFCRICNIQRHPTSPVRSPSISLKMPKKLATRWAKSSFQIKSLLLLQTRLSRERGNYGVGVCLSFIRHESPKIVLLVDSMKLSSYALMSIVLKPPLPLFMFYA